MMSTMSNDPSTSVKWKRLHSVAMVTALLVLPPPALSADSGSVSDELSSRHARSERCAQGTYYSRETSGAQEVWSLSAGGTFQGVNAAERVFGFSGQLGNWKIVADDPISAEVTYLDFVYDPGGIVPLLIGRVDISMVFGDNCETIEGTIELRLFDPLDDPLDPSGSPIVSADTFEGRRVR